MKSLLTLFAVAICFSMTSQAQAPKMMNYQGAARDAQGNVLTNKTIALKLHIISGSDIDNPVYSELQSVKTNNFGLFNLKIGEGEILKGSFDAIEWSDTDHFISMELDIENNDHFQMMGVSQLLSVPYAFYAEKAGKAIDIENGDQYRDIPFSGTNGQTIRHNGSDWEASSTLYNNGNNIGIGTTNPDSKLDINGSINVSSGNEITFAGDRALAMDANRNIMQGRQAGKDLTSGVNNNMIGYRAGWKTTTGSNNSIIGYQAGYANTTGNANNFIGYKAGNLNTTGNNNFFGGLQAGFGNTTGKNNLALGNNAGYSLGDALNNTFVGRSAGYSTTGNENVFIGYEAGDNNTTGYQNTYIGTGAGSSSGLINNATAIGANTVVGQSNSVVLGNNANVGIGTSFPQSKLHLYNTNGTYLSVQSEQETTIRLNRGTSSFESAVQFMTNGSITWLIGMDNAPIANSNDFSIKTSNNSTAEFLINADGNVGIGTVNPNYLLHVNGNAAKPGGGSWTVASDKRLKQDIQPYKDGLTKLMTINPVKFHYNEKSGFDTRQEYYGVIAQELKEVAPYMVGSFEKDGMEYLDVDNSAMVYMLINAVKEQQNQIDELKKQLSKKQ